MKKEEPLEAKQCGCPQCEYQAPFRDDLHIHIRSESDENHRRLNEEVKRLENRADRTTQPMSVDPNRSPPSRGFYLFPVRIGEECELLPNVAAQMPGGYTVENLEQTPDNLKPVLETLYPDKDIKPVELITNNLLSPTKGILVSRRYSRPHSALGYHPGLAEEQARVIIKEIETHLGYKLNGTEELQHFSSEDTRCRFAKTAGWKKDSTFTVASSSP